VNEHSIRVATLNDAAAVEALLQVCYPPLMERAYDMRVLAQALSVMTTANPMLLSSGTFYLAGTIDGSVIGCGGWTPGRPDTGHIEQHVGHLRHFGTHPAWIKRGIGKAIFQRCVVSGGTAGITTFEVYSSLNAEPFYQALGFRPLRHLSLELSPGIVLPTILMRRVLPKDSIF
jgi:N-acetylglutamate synthase-like GNAT family acetyltransferase